MVISGLKRKHEWMMSHCYGLPFSVPYWVEQSSINNHVYESRAKVLHESRQNIL